MIFVRSHTRMRPRDLLLMHLLPAVLVFIAVMLIITLNVQSAQLQNQRDQYSQAVARADEVENRVRMRMATYEEATHAAAAFISAAPAMPSNDQFRDFMGTFKLNSRYPGISTVAYAKMISKDEIPTFTEQQRASDQPDFTIYPGITSDRALVLTYISPQVPSAASGVGFNLLSDPVTSEAAHQAIVSGDLALSGNVRLITQPDKGQGFLLLAPIYSKSDIPTDADTRVSSATGAITTAFAAHDFFSALFSSHKDSGFGFRISQADNPPMYTSAAFEAVAGQPGAGVFHRILNIYGQQWRIDYSYGQGSFGTGLSSGALKSLAGGAVFSGLIATLVFVLLLSRTRSLGIAEERDIQNAKDDLLSLASHQLRTPATSVKQYLGMIKEGYAGKLNEQQASLLEEAYTSNERQLGIINEMLYVARADAGRIVLDKSELHLNKLLRDIHKDQYPRAKSFQQRLNLIVPKMDIVILADGHYLRMAIENIVSNAIKYTPKGGMATIKLTRDTRNAIISISDTGVGIAKQDHKKIFDKFSRVPNELSTRTNGTGVGLYLAKQIIELHSGKISFTSDAGKGTTFTITLPRNAETRKSV